MLTWANPAFAQAPTGTPKLIISPLELHVSEGESKTYTVEFDRNPAGFEGVGCGELVYVNMTTGVAFLEFGVEPRNTDFETGNTNCEEGD